MQAKLSGSPGNPTTGMVPLHVISLRSASPGLQGWAAGPGAGDERGRVTRSTTAQQA